MTKINKNTHTNQLGELLKKSEFWIGLGVVIVGLGIAGGLLMGNNRTENIANHGITAPTLTQRPNPTTYISKAPSRDLKQITRLADTAGLYTVIEGDNFWRISKKVCGSGKYFLSIQSQNKGQSLHAGDQVVANCSL